MSKRRPVKRKKTKGRRRKKKAPPAFARVIASLLILVILVVGLALLANYFLLRRPAGTMASLPPGPPVKRPEYEIFSSKVPPPPPVVRRPGNMAGRQPKVAIIIDDMGYDLVLGRRLITLDPGITFSFLPFAPFKKKIRDDALRAGHEIMLHLPMEPKEFPRVNPGPGALLADMSPDELIAQLERDLADIGPVKGVNNHMGSRLTAMDAQMRQIFTILKKRKLFFIDSRTTAATVCRPSATLLHLPFAQRDVFIDHVDDRLFIRRQLKSLVERAKKQGFAVGIAHPHPKTLEVLEEMLPEIQAQVELVPASQVVAVAGS